MVFIKFSLSKFHDPHETCFWKMSDFWGENVLNVYFLKITSKSGTFNETCTAQQGQNTINLSLKCQNKPVILMRVDSQHNSRLSFQENFARILRKFPEIFDFRG